MEPLYGEATRRRLKTIEARWLRGGVGRQCDTRCLIWYRLVPSCGLALCATVVRLQPRLVRPWPWLARFVCR
eukprot:scaffold50964_cov59-Phaeocystis_antarctica.AAC.1